MQKLNARNAWSGLWKRINFWYIIEWWFNHTKNGTGILKSSQFVSLEKYRVLFLQWCKWPTQIYTYKANKECFLEKFHSFNPGCDGFHKQLDACYVCIWLLLTFAAKKWNTRIKFCQPLVKVGQQSWIDHVSEVSEVIFFNTKVFEPSLQTVAWKVGKKIRLHKSLQRTPGEKLCPSCLFRWKNALATFSAC